jgi:hypothetical protein
MIDRAPNGTDDENTPHAFGVDDIAPSSKNPASKHAFGVDDVPAPQPYSKLCSRGGSVYPSATGSVLPGAEGLVNSVRETLQ